VESLDFKKKIKALPSPSPVLRRVSTVVADPASSMDEVVAALKLDPSIAGKILQLANSAYIGIPRSISSLRNAVILLGLKRVQSVIMVSQFVEPLDVSASMHPFSLERFWRHSMTVGLVAESIGRHCKRYEAVDEQELFSAALLHDVGKLAVAAHDASIVRTALEQSNAKGIPFYRAEIEELSHTTVGAHLADQWGFPLELSRSIANHHAPMTEGSLSRFVAIVQVADAMVHLVGYSTFENEMTPMIDEKALCFVPLPPERLRIIAENEAENQKRIEELCGIFSK
jgi:putative nucleotidyltransferase with HDIG domain